MLVLAVIPHLEAVGTISTRVNRSCKHSSTCISVYGYLDEQYP